MNPRELLQFLLEGQELSEEQLDTFIAEYSEEGLYHDFKSGEITRDSRKTTKDIRSYISGFANSIGGVFFLGIDEPTSTTGRRVSPCKKMFGEMTIDDWVLRQIQDMAAFLSPPARVQSIDHTDGLVVIIATSRAPGLVPCIEEGRIKYYLRVGDSTVEAPDYLISDLVLGHRQLPSLELTLERSSTLIQRTNRSYQPIFGFAIENLGLVIARGLRIGIAALGQPSNRISRSTLMRSYIDLDFSCASELELGFYESSGKIDLDLFRSHSIVISGPQLPHSREDEYSAAITVMQEGGAPSWYELTFKTDYPDDMDIDVPSFMKRFQERWAASCHLKRVLGRPRVALLRSGGRNP